MALISNAHSEIWALSSRHYHDGQYKLASKEVENEDEVVATVRLDKGVVFLLRLLNSSLSSPNQTT